MPVNCTITSPPCSSSSSSIITVQICGAFLRYLMCTGCGWDACVALFSNCPINHNFAATFTRLYWWSISGFSCWALDFIAASVKLSPGPTGWTLSQWETFLPRWIKFLCGFSSSLGFLRDLCKCRASGEESESPAQRYNPATYMLK